MNARTPLALFSFVLLLACAGMFPRGPWQGETHFVAMLTSQAPAADVDAAVFSERLRMLGVTVEVTQLSSTRLRLDVSDARSAEVMAHVMPRFELEISSPHGTLRNEHVALATPQLDELLGYPMVQVVLTEDGGATFCELSKATVGQAVAITVDGKVLSAPIVQEPICGGRLQISMGQATFEEAQALATGLGSAPLSTTWTLETIDLE